MFKLSGIATLFALESAFGGMQGVSANTLRQAEHNKIPTPIEDAADEDASQDVPVPMTLAQTVTAYPSVEGYWNWKHDGVNVQGDIILKSGGDLEYFGASGGSWEFTPEGRVYMEFAGVKHTMVFTNDNKNLILVEPFRSPPTVATFSEKLLDPLNIAGTYENLQYQVGKGKNDWHYVDVIDEGEGAFTWENRAGRTWTLTSDEESRDMFEVGKDCPYYVHGHTEADIKMDGVGEGEENIIGIYGPWGELYTKMCGNEACGSPFYPGNRGAENLCEGHGFNQYQCQALDSCCHFNDGKCWSSVGGSECSV